MTALPVRLALAVVSGLAAAASFEPFGWAYLLPAAVFPTSTEQAAAAC